MKIKTTHRIGELSYAMLAAAVALTGCSRSEDQAVVAPSATAEAPSASASDGVISQVSTGPGAANIAGVGATSVTQVSTGDGSVNIAGNTGGTVVVNGVEITANGKRVKPGAAASSVGN